MKMKNKLLALKRQVMRITFGPVNDITYPAIRRNNRELHKKRIENIVFFFFKKSSKVNGAGL